MWRVWALLLVSAVLGAEEFLQGDDAEDLERRLDDLRVLGEVQVRWRVRGAAREWERLHWYQRVEWEPRIGQEFFAVVERDPGERRLYDFNAFYYGAQMGKGRLVIGDFRPGFGTGMVFGRRSRGGCRPGSQRRIAGGWDTDRAGRTNHCAGWWGVMGADPGKGFCSGEGHVGMGDWISLSGSVRCL